MGGNARSDTRYKEKETESVLRNIAIPLVSLMLASAANAGEWQASVGIADELDDDYAPVVTLGYVTGHRFPVEIVCGYIGSRHLAPGEVDPTWFLGTSLRWTGSWWFVGGGVAAVNDQSEVLSSWYQFMTLAGVRKGDWVLTVRHLSNASTRGRNRGETFLTLGWAW